MSQPSRQPLAKPSADSGAGVDANGDAEPSTAAATANPQRLAGGGGAGGTFETRADRVASD